MTAATLEAPLVTSEHIRVALESAAGPQPVKTIQKALPKAVRPKELQLAEMLEDEVAAGRLSRYPAKGRGKAPRYSHVTPRELAIKLLLQRVECKSHTFSSALRISKTDIKHDPIATELPALLEELIASRRVHVHLTKSSGKGKPKNELSTSPADVGAYVRDALQELSTSLRVPLDELLNAAVKPPMPETAPTEAPVDTARLVLDAIHELNPAVARGDVVSIAELRRRLDFQLDKATFDNCLLKLASDWKVTLHGFDHAESLSPEERAVYVEDQQGRLHNVVSLRRDA